MIGTEREEVNMAKSLQEQLLGAGLVDNKKAKSLKQEKRKQKKQLGRDGLKQQESENRDRLEAERREKAERDRALNQKKQEELREKEILAQIKQLVDRNALDVEGDQSYQFVDGKKIRKIYVSELVANQLANGVVSIVKQGDSYCVVPKAVAEKIAQRDDGFVLVLNERGSQVEDEDDPYKDYKIPDDLMW
jgi:uncharacterized protein YaiL (DUF2058 family)